MNFHWKPPFHLDYCIYNLTCSIILLECFSYSYMVMHTEHRHLGAKCEPCTTPTLVTSTCPCLSSRLFEVRSPTVDVTISTFDIRHLAIRDPRKKTLWAIPHPSALYVSSAYQLGMRSSTNVRDTYRARPRYGIGRLGILPNISISHGSQEYIRDYSRHGVKSFVLRSTLFESITTSGLSN